MCFKNIYQISFFIGVFCLFFYSTLGAQNNIISKNNNNNNNTNNAVNQTKWITQLFHEAESIFDLGAASPNCARDIALYKTHLLNQSVWAVRMMESSEWPSVGVYTGMRYHLGNFDECLLVSEYGIKGKYCVVDAKYEFMNYNQSQENGGTIDDKESVWSTMTKLKKNPITVDRTRIHWALCIPASCSAKDLNDALNKTIVPLFRKYNVNIDINVDPEKCSVKNEIQTFTSGFYITCIVFLTMLALMVIGTFYDVLRKKVQDTKVDERRNKFLMSFSLVKNFKKLTDTKSSSDIQIIHFFKFINMIFVVYGHRFIYSLGYPMHNVENVERIYRELSSIELVHTNVVDVFFMVSGFLTFYFGFMPTKKGGLLYYLLSIIFRWIRMVPVYSIVIAFIVFLLPQLGNGPLWQERVSIEVDNCWSTWWANLLAVSNFIKPENQCLVISWYIADDIQLVIIGGFILYVLTRYKKLGIFLIIFTFVLATSVTFAVAYINRYDGLLRLYMTLLENPRNEEQFTNLYISLYSRAGPFLTGFIAAYAVKIFQERGYKLTRKQMLVTTALVLLFGEGGQYYGLLFYTYGRPYSAVENAIYASLNRTLFALAYAWCTFLYMTSGLGFLNNVVQYPILAPLGRLTYSVFLVNTVVQLYHAAYQRSLQASNVKMNLIWMAGSDLIFSFVFGLILHLFAEAPITNLSKIIQQKIVKKKVKSMNTTPEAISDRKTSFSEKNAFGKTEENVNGKVNGIDNNGFTNNIEYIPSISNASRL